MEEERIKIIKEVLLRKKLMEIKALIVIKNGFYMLPIKIKKNKK